MDANETHDLVKTAGGPVKVAERLGVTHSAVCQWRKIPAKHVGRMSAITGVPPHRIRPDLFPDPSGLLQSAPAEAG